MEPARTQNVALLVVGDPFGATTHSDLHWRAVEMGIPVRGTQTPTSHAAHSHFVVIHNASIMNAVGCCGLQLYRFGQTVSITFLEEANPFLFLGIVVPTSKNKRKHNTTRHRARLCFLARRMTRLLPMSAMASCIRCVCWTSRCAVKCFCLFVFFFVLLCLFFHTPC